MAHHSHLAPTVSFPGRVREGDCNLRLGGAWTTRERLRNHLVWRWERLARHLPPTVVGTLDLVLPHEGKGWSGALNGQDGRKAVVRQIAAKVDVRLVIETGSFRGYSTRFFARAFKCPVWTVEANPRWHAHTRARLALSRRVTVTHGDSRECLRALTKQADRGDVVFAYLDAHWEQDVPLREEIALIASTWPRAVVMIDDFQVPGDPGYEYDDWGPGIRFTAELLETCDLIGWTVLYPTLPSNEETGRARGSCVLMSPALHGTEIAGLRTRT